MSQTPFGGLPRNEDAERCVLGAILRDSRCADEVLELLDPDDFYDERHKRIYEAIRGQRLDQEQVDLITLADRLRGEKKLSSVGGEAFLMELTESVVSAAGVLAHCDIVREKAMLRGLIGSANKILESAYDGADKVDEIVDRASSEMLNVSDRRSTESLVEVQKLLPDTMQRILSYQKGEVFGTPTGFKALDEHLNGLAPQALIILAARPAMGKTAFALNIATNAALGRGAKNNEKSAVAIFSLEMGRYELSERLICAEAQINGKNLHRGLVPRKDLARITDAIVPLRHAPIYIDDTPGINIMGLRARCKRLHTRLARDGKGLGLIVVDYLQLMEASSSGGGDNRQNEVAQMSRGLKKMAKELNCPVLALSQLSREAEKQGDGKPRLSHLRESGAIEQDADIVMFIYREEVYDKEKGEKGKAEIIIEKHRNGPTGSVFLSFVGDHTRFYDYSDRQEPVDPFYND